MGHPRGAEVRPEREAGLDPGGETVAPTSEATARLQAACALCFRGRSEPPGWQAGRGPPVPAPPTSGKGWLGPVWDAEVSSVSTPTPSPKVSSRTSGSTEHSFSLN